MGLLNYLGGRGSSGYGEGSSRHVRSTLTALLIWVVMVSAVRTLAMAAFMYITRFNVEERAGWK